MALFATAFLLTVLALPPVRRAAVAVGAVDIPGDSRRMHHRPIPRMGGVGLALGAAGAAALLPEAIPLRLAAPLLCGGLLSAALGMTDDIVSLSPWGKLCGQACIALLPGAFGLAPVLPGGKVAGAAFSFALTLLLMNAVNLIDGLDGLAAGCVLLSGAALALARGNAPAALLCGGCLGFLPCNLPPARLFLGDAGSLFLGYGLAVALLGEPVFSPALLLFAAYPLTDLFFAFFRRALAGQNPFAADAHHLHHRLAAVTSPRRAALLLCCLQGACALCGMLLLR